MTVTTRPNLVDRRRVQVDEEGTGDVFAATGLGEKGFVGTAIEDILRIGIRATIQSETVLKKVPEERRKGGNDQSSVPSFDVVHGRGGETADGKTLTAPKRCYRAGYRPGPSEDVGSVARGSISFIRYLASSLVAMKKQAIGLVRGYSRRRWHR